ncbi:hypothetical protein PsorP6_017918 [Peronosclerospora sorghi]|uniref:Uncharacterized protein n=1 Tax=Peronosclerospora sorghi TaxID=230839 RepID=A0ACC0WC43_9STRA|nr:hypothetical protein PsorP6_017918 [Peronosclerospora sorghi]
MQQRFATYKQKYHKAKLLRTGDGITDEDIARGILTVYQKSNCICPQYARMDAVFGTKSNVTAMAEYDRCLIASSEEEDEREENYDDEEDENEFDTFVATNFKVPPGSFLGKGTILAGDPPPESTLEEERQEKAREAREAREAKERSSEERRLEREQKRADHLEL